MPVRTLQNVKSSDASALRRSVAAVVRTVLIAAAYFGMGHLMGLLAVAPGYATPVWPSAGLALVGALLWGRAAVVGVLLGSWVLNALITLRTDTLGPAVVAGAVVGVGAALQAWVGARLVARVVGPGNPLEQGGSVPMLLLLGGPVTCVINAAWGTLGLVALGQGSPDHALADGLTWWVGDSIGVLLVAPLLLAVFASPSAWYLRRLASLAVPLGVCLVGVSAIFRQTMEEAEDDTRHAFEARAVVIAASFFGALQRVEAYTESVARVLGAVPDLDREAFEAMVNPWIRANPCITAFEWAPVVPADRLDAFELSVRDEHPDYEVTELASPGVLRPVRPHGVHTPIRFIEPLPRERSALGYDLSSSPERRRALELASTTGGVVLTEAVRLVAYPQEWGVLAVSAAYSGPAQVADASSRPVSGFVATVLRVGELVEAARVRAGTQPLSMRVTDLTASPPLLLSGPDGAAAPDELAWSTRDTVGGRSWLVEVRGVHGVRAWVGWTVLAAGLACTGLVTAFVLDAGTRALKVERLVAERTAALEQVNDALTRSNLELQRFAYVASHDMREPLRTIHCFAELLQQEDGDRLGDEGRDHVRRIVAATRRMQGLVREVLAYSRIEGGGEVFDLVPLAEPVIAALEDLDALVRESGATVVVEALPSAWCDRVQMVQLFQNLLSNAIKFRRPDVAAQIKVSGRQTASGVEVVVRDNGIGVEPRFFDRIFEMFQTLHAAGRYPGQGIGLATCRKIVERHGGHIWMTSVPGLGSAVHVVLRGAPPRA